MNIIAYKIYDHCKRQDCLTHKQLGPSRVLSCHNKTLSECNIVRPPQRTASITIDDLKIRKIYVQKKRANTTKPGYWDISVGFVFEYLLTFWEVDGCAISTVAAGNIYSMKATLHGSLGSGRQIATDFYLMDDSLVCDTAPFVLATANAVCLDAAIRRNEVRVKIGLFSVLKLLRFAELDVLSSGYCNPDDIVDWESFYSELTSK